MDARRRRGIKKASLRQERQTAADIGGRTTANSGAARFSGGADVRAPGTMRVECKFTEKDTYSLKLKELEKLRKQALKSLEVPVFQFAFKFRNTMEKYAVIRCTEPYPKNCMWIEAESTTLKRDWLAVRLNEGPFFITLGATKAGEPDSGKVFQILRWDDFMQQFEGMKDFSMGCLVKNQSCTICDNRPCEHKES